MAGFDLGKQVGPLPMGGWLVVIAGGLGVGYIINRNMAKPADETAANPSVVEQGVGAGGGQFIYEPPQTGTEDNAPDTNQSWGRKALNWLIAQNFSPTKADDTVRKYLSGLPLDVAGDAMMALVLAVQGPPPEPLPVVQQPDTPPPTTPPKTVPLPGPVVNFHATPGKRRVTLTWKFSGPPIGGFYLKITKLNSGHTKSLFIPASSRSYTYNISPAWTKKSTGKLQFYMRAFQGGWAVPNKRWGPGRTINAVPLF